MEIEGDLNENIQVDESEDRFKGELEESSDDSAVGSGTSTAKLRSHVHQLNEKDHEVPKKKKKRGIVYLSSIPKYMTVAILREILGRYASIGRVYLQAANNTKENQAKKRKIRRHFTEGWVELESKRAAKQIAASLNSTPIATRKSSKFFDVLWCLKYLPRFKWTHLSERLTYEKAVYKQRLKTEVAQARREASFFQDNLDKSERNKKKKKKTKASNE